MTEETPTSGNRWEPSDQPAEPAQPTEQPAEPAQPPAAPGPVPEYAAAEPVARAPWRTSARTAVAGGAVAVLIAGSLGGFALGRATAGGEDDQVRYEQQGGPGGFDRDGDSDRDDDGRGFDGPGFPPDQDQGFDPDSDGTDSQDS